MNSSMKKRFAYLLVFFFSFLFMGEAQAELWSETSHEVLSTDFNNDGHLDLVLRGTPRSVTVPYDITVDLASTFTSFMLLDNGDGTYTVAIADAQMLDNLQLSQTDYEIKVGDFNGDGEPDYLLTSPTQDDLLIHSADSGRNASVEQRFSSSDIANGASIIVADIDYDGQDDLVIVSDAEQKVAQAGANGRFPALGGTGGSNAVAMTRGSAGVSGDGSANYNIPITLPPARGGLAPSLSINYSSNNGIGDLGVGWGLAGIESIGRCKPIIPTEGNSKALPMTAAERFCLNGSKLIAVTGEYGANNTEYRTELDRFVKVKSYGAAGTGPLFFKVWSKDGLILEFGNTGDSRVVPAGGTTASRWSLNRVSDLFGNFYKVTYTFNADTGEHYPDHIDYSPEARVDFKYEDRGTADGRADVLWQFKSGAEYSLTKRLERITTSIAGNPVRHYELNYERSPSTSRSRLKSLSECAYGGSGGAVCARPIAFSWQEGGAGFESTPTTQVSASRSTGIQPMMFDADGDGYKDLVWAQYDTWWVAEGTETGFSAPINTYVTEGAKAAYAGGAQPLMLDENGAYGILVVVEATSGVLVAGQDPINIFYWGVMTLHKANGSYTGLVHGGQITPTMGAKPIVGDFNNDGRDDVFGFIENPIVDALNTFYSDNGILHDESDPGTIEQAHNAFVAIRTEAPFTDGSVGFWKHYVTGVANNYSEESTYSLEGSFSADINGDGVDDVFYKRDGSWESLLSFPTGESVQDTNGFWHKVYAFNRIQSGIPSGVCANGNGTMADLNVDGLPDVLVRISNNWKAYINTGNGFTPYSTGLSTTDPNPTLMALNYDSDGNTDFLVKQESVWDIYSTYINLGEVSLQKEQALSIAGGFYTGERPFITDVDGDGLGDILFYVQGNWHAYLHNSGKPDLLTGVVDGADITTTFRYGSTADPEVHTFEKNECVSSDLTSCFPYHSIRGGLYVVDELKSSNGKGGFNRVTYHYRGGKAHLQGRGFMGFAEQIITDHQLGIVSSKSFRQDFPFTGNVTRLAVAEKGKSCLKLLELTMPNW